MGNVRRIYVEKKPAFAVRARGLYQEIIHYLGINTVENVRALIRYDMENVSEEVYRSSLAKIFYEPPVDFLYEETFDSRGGAVFSVEYLPGQFDQRADSACQCVQLLNEEEEPVIQTATTYVIEGTVSEEELVQIKGLCINPVDSREAGEEKPETLRAEYEEPEDVAVMAGFTQLGDDALWELYGALNLAMTMEDFRTIQAYFQEEHRNPTITEIRVLDTYWSDHCRHTTFLTELTEVSFGEGDYREPIEGTYRKYLEDREHLCQGRTDKYVSLMDLALMGMKKLRSEGKLQDLEESEEINACSILVPVEIDGQVEEWIVSFKNETHNHPTEIEPFGGAATCLGGAIRDPLSGRAYVYQAMRVTGAADPRVPVAETLKGKLPQKKIVREAALGYSSYGNQIGLATGYVKEIYHPGYVAKHLETGAVLGAAPRKNVLRGSSRPGDRIILLGGRTGRDGCGGATGSSKAHTEASIEVCGAEVQKGNPPTERKIQRLFRRGEVSTLIKKCNDFGAGGVSVAIGELAEGLLVDLDKVKKKYAGLDATELAISESQERMAVVVDQENVEAFLHYAAEENLEATEVALVTEEPRLVLTWRGREVVNISRAFLDTNGAHQRARVQVQIPQRDAELFAGKEVDDFRQACLAALADLNVCSQKGLVEQFDSTIGAGTVLMPYGGTYQMTESQCMVSKLPIQGGDSDTATIMSHGFDPYLSSFSPYHGAVYAVLESVAKIVAVGGDYKKIRFSFQEYFQRMSEDPARWSQPFTALLGAYAAQIGLGLPAIGGKDSMSGTFQDIDVPPTLISFAVDVAPASKVISPSFKKAGNVVVKFSISRDAYDLPDFSEVCHVYGEIHDLIERGVICSAYALDRHGALPALCKMAFGGKMGMALNSDLPKEEFFTPSYGEIVAELEAGALGELTIPFVELGVLEESGQIRYQDTVIALEEAIQAWNAPLEKVFPTKSDQSQGEELAERPFGGEHFYICKHKVARPSVFIPVFPGTNCEYDSRRVFERAGAKVETKVFRNLNGEDIKDSLLEYERAIRQAQIIMFPGGFSAGDEPEGSAKFFATVFRNGRIAEAVNDLLTRRDGLMLGICNGFQALIKLGLVPYGEIREQRESSPTLTYNTIGRHISRMVYTKVASNKSPWLRKAKPGDVFVNPASHGEGRFVAPEDVIENLFANGQVATQYADPEGRIFMEEEWNVNGSYQAIEGITSPDGRIFGKMAHCERLGAEVGKNIDGEQDLKLFEAGVEYFL